MRLVRNICASLSKVRSFNTVSNRHNLITFHKQLALERLEDRTMLSATATMLGREIQLPSWLIPDEILIAQEAIGRITTTYSDAQTYTGTAQSYDVVNQDEYFANPTYSDYDGSGYSVVIVDTGAHLDHPAFGPDNDSNGIGDRIVYQHDFSGFGDDDATDPAVLSHGTNVASIAAGMAPGADLIILKVFNDIGSGIPNYIQSALQWVVEHWDDFNIVAVNMSLTHGGNYSTNVTPIEFTYNDELAALEALRVIPVTIAGNDFFTNNSAPGVAYPGADPSVITVGATWDGNNGGPLTLNSATNNTTGTDHIAAFSQRHSTLSHIFAPGARITAGSATFRGTSQAAPHVAAAIALAQQINMELHGTRLNRTEVIDLLQDTGVTINDGDDENDNVINTGLNFKRLDLDAMADALIPPQIHDVVLDGVMPNGQDWSRTPYSFAELVPAGEQLAPIYTQGVNRIQIHFSEHVQKPNGDPLDGSEMALYATGVQTGGATRVVQHVDFDYDPDTHVATWTFNQLTGDKYRIDIESSGMTDATGDALDGHWENDTNGTLEDWNDDPVGRPFEPGNGKAGSSFQFQFTLLPGDYDQSGVVNVADNGLGDGDGNGAAAQQGDFNVLVANLGSRLPLGRENGDYNDDDRVHADDYAVVRAMFGMSGGNLAADGNNDGTVNSDDLTLFQNWMNTIGGWYSPPMSGLGSLLPVVDLANAPRVMNVTMSGSDSTHAPSSFDTVDGSGQQLLAVPVGKANTISITFSEDVNVFASNLTLVGLQTANRPVLEVFDYDMATMTATWRFELFEGTYTYEPIAADQYAIVLSDAVTDIEGNRLDGEWKNPAALTTTNSAISEFPSGNGSAGGDFVFVVTINQGDFDQNGLLDYSGDLSTLWANLGHIYSGAEFEQGDFDGDGDVDQTDNDLWSAYFELLDLRTLSLLGDLNGDWAVDDIDMQELGLNVGMSNPTREDGDLNGDGVVDEEDLDLMFPQYGLDLDVVS